MAEINREWNGVETFPIHDFHHIELYVGNARQAAYYYVGVFGMKPYAYSGPETGNRDAVSYVLKQRDIYIVLTTPLNSVHPAAAWINQHGDGVRDIAFRVPDAELAFRTALEKGAGI